MTCAGHVLCIVSWSEACGTVSTSVSRALCGVIVRSVWRGCAQLERPLWGDCRGVAAGMAVVCVGYLCVCRGGVVDRPACTGDCVWLCDLGFCGTGKEALEGAEERFCGVLVQGSGGGGGLWVRPQ